MNGRPGALLVGAALACALLLTTAAAPAAADPGFRGEPYTVVFDFVPVGSTSAPQKAVVYNPGTSATTLGALEVRGTHATDFAITQDGCSGRTIASGGGCEVQLVFRPSAAGTRVASLRVPDATPCANWIQLAGSGTATSAPPRARAAVCSAPKSEVSVQVTPSSGVLPSIRDNSIIEGGGKTCSSRRRFRIRLSPPRGTNIEKAKVMIAGKEIPTKKVGGRTTAMIDLRGRRRGTAVVEITIDATNGRTYKGKRTYRTCSGKEQGGSPRY